MNKILLLFKAGCLTAINTLLCNSAMAQIAVDGTTNSTVNSVDNSNFIIENGDKPNGMTSLRAGGNLFHSFDQFSIPNGGSAVFNNVLEIENILSRVTGGNISNIDGLIRANGNANLFLINPAGIIFGEGARLDIGGSFYSGSASSILFEDGEFSAADINAPVLTINAPIGLGFRDNPGDVVNLSAANDVGLEVLAGESISLFGGSIN